MQEALTKKLAHALGNIDRPGSFCVSGSAPAVLPGLEVDGLGPIGLPLTVKQAKDLKEHCSQAAYGKGVATLVDTSVRRVWRLEPGKFSLTNPDWETFLQQTVGKVQEELGLEKQKVASHLYDLLLYEKGSFFLPHRDGEKLDRMVATLVIVLPSAHEGGELVVRHDGQEQVIDFASADKRFQIRFAAFYADCEHEVRPLRKGYRLCLVYNLTLAKAKKPIGAPCTSKQIESMTAILNEWASDEAARTLVLTLDHQYTEKGLSWDALKGTDRARANVLAESAERAGCKAYLGLLTFWESGSPTGDSYDYGRRRRWDRYDDDDEDGEHEMDEVYDTKLSVTHCKERDGQAMPFAELTLKEENLLDAGTLKNVKPEEEFEGFTGNAGMTLEHWYRHAALILWPEQRHFDIVCDQDVAGAVPLLKKLVTQCHEASGKKLDALVMQCAELARAILASWPTRENGYYPSSKVEKTDFLESLNDLGDPTLIRRFIGELMLRDVSLEPGKSLVIACRQHGWSAFQTELVAVFKNPLADAIMRNSQVLEQIGLANARKEEGWRELCEILAQELVLAVQTLDEPKAKDDWRAERMNDAELLAGLARGLLAADQSDLLTRVIAHALELPKKYPFAETILAALLSLKSWPMKHVKTPSEGLSRWITVCREQLESQTATIPPRPVDFRRPAKVACKCQFCQELNQFLADPDNGAHRFRATQVDRSHLEHAIGRHNCDVNMKTERTRPTHTLVCTKNTKSFEETLKKYHRDRQRLAAVQAIEASMAEK